MLIYRETKLPVKPSAHLLKDHIVHKRINCVVGLADKSEGRIRRVHQDGKRSEIKFCGLTNFHVTNITIKTK